MIKYTLKSKITNIEEFENVEIFGIKAYKDEKVVFDIDDISPNKQFVENIIHKLIKYNVSIYHIIDVIEDELFTKIEK